MCEREGLRISEFFVTKLELRRFIIHSRHRKTEKVMTFVKQLIRVMVANEGKKPQIHLFSLILLHSEATATTILQIKPPI